MRYCVNCRRPWPCQNKMSNNIIHICHSKQHNINTTAVSTHLETPTIHATVKRSKGCMREVRGEHYLLQQLLVQYGPTPPMRHPTNDMPVLRIGDNLVQLPRKLARPPPMSNGEIFSIGVGVLKLLLSPSLQLQIDLFIGVG